MRLQKGDNLNGVHDLIVEGGIVHQVSEQCIMCPRSSGGSTRGFMHITMSHGSRGGGGGVGC